MGTLFANSCQEQAKTPGNFKTKVRQLQSHSTRDANGWARPRAAIASPPPKRTLIHQTSSDRFDHSGRSRPTLVSRRFLDPASNLYGDSIYFVLCVAALAR